MLHGEIKVNHQVIMEWEAVRTSTLRDKGNGMYEYSVFMEDIQTHEQIHCRIWHKYIDGAPALVRRIMERWDEEVRSRGGSSYVQTAQERHDRIRAGEREVQSRSGGVSLSDSDVSSTRSDASESEGAV